MVLASLSMTMSNHGYIIHQLWIVLTIYHHESSLRIIHHHIHHLINHYKPPGLDHENPPLTKPRSPWPSPLGPSFQGGRIQQQRRRLGAGTSKSCQREVDALRLGPFWVNWWPVQF